VYRRVSVAAVSVLLAGLVFPTTATAATPPAAPYRVTTFPAVDAIGVAWEGEASTFHVERSLDGVTWTPVGDVSSSNQTKFLVDPGVAAGQSVDFRITGDNSGALGPGVVIHGTRPATQPSAVDSRVLAVGSTATGAQPLVIRSSAADTTIDAGFGALPTVSGMYEPAGTALSYHISYYAGPVPGPGTYTDADGLMFWLSGATATGANCVSRLGSVLQVRSVVYGEDLVPQVLDASWTHWCADGTVVRGEIRYGVPGDVTLLTSDPGKVGLLTTWNGTPVTQPVTVSNNGPDAVDLGAASITGGSATDWSISDDTCSGAHLAVGGQCTVTVAFATSATGLRNSWLRLPVSASTGALAPHVVALQGRGATPPQYQWIPTVTNVLTGVRLAWSPPGDDGGVPVLRYELQRRPMESADPWTSLPDLPPTLTRGRVLAWDPLVPDGAFDYRVRAVNAVGPAAWMTVTGQLATLGVFYDQRTSSDAPSNLLQTSIYGSDTPVPMGLDPSFDYVDPAVSPGGSRLVYARSTNPGIGSDDEYDLWLTRPAVAFGRTAGAPVQLTSLPGAERDPVVSPDASLVAFTHVAGDGTTSVWVVPTAGGAPHEVSAAYSHPAWNERGTALVMQRTGGDALAYLTVDPTSGLPTEGGTVSVAGTNGGTDPAVSRTGVIAFITSSGALATVAPGDTTATIVKPSGPYLTYSDPGFANDGHLLVTELHTGVPVFVRDLQTGATHGDNGVGRGAPAIRDVLNPFITIDHSLGGVVNGTQSVDFSYLDGIYDEETPHVALRVTCQLDAASPTPCASPWARSGLADGRHTLRIRVRDEVGHQALETLPFISDTSGPSVTIDHPSFASMSSLTRFAWRGTDRQTTVGQYDVRWARAKAGQPLGTWRVLPRSTKTRLDLPISVGDELCVRVRGINGAGVVGQWRKQCTTRPWDDAILDATGSWRLRTTPNAYQESLTVTSSRGAVLTVPSTVMARRVSVLAQTCPTCGSIRVYVGTHLLGTLSLRSATTRSHVWLRSSILASPVTGKLRLVTTSRSAVRIDAVLAARS